MENARTRLTAVLLSVLLVTSIAASATAFGAAEPTMESDLDERFDSLADEVADRNDLAVPEYPLGDVTTSGEVTIEDVMAIHRYRLGLEPDADAFDETLADVDRDGDVTTADVVLAHRTALGTVDGAALRVASVDAPERVAQGETVDVEVGIENDGAVGAIEEVTYEVANVETSTVVDVGGADTDRNVTSVTFEVEIEWPPDEYVQTISVGDDEVRSPLTVDGRANGTIAGVVTDEVTGNEVEGVNVTAENDDGSVETATTDEDGSYELTITDGFGPRVVYVADAPDGYVTEDVVHVEPGDELEVDLEVTPAEATIAGTVVDPTGAPVEGAAVFDGDPTTGAFETRTDDEGAFEVVLDDVEGIGHGDTVAVRADAPGFERSTVEFVTVEPGENEVDFGLDFDFTETEIDVNGTEVIPSTPETEATVGTEFEYRSLGGEAAAFVSVDFGTDAVDLSDVDGGDATITDGDEVELAIADAFAADGTTLVLELDEAIATPHVGDAYDVDVEGVVTPGTGAYDLTVGLHEDEEGAPGPAFAADAEEYRIGDGEVTAGLSDEVVSIDDGTVAVELDVESFTDDAPEVRGYDVAVEFDPEVVSFVGSEGVELADPVEAADDGAVRLLAVDATDTPTPATAATLEFEPVAAGSTALAIDRDASDVGGTGGDSLAPVWADGSIVVTDEDGETDAAATDGADGSRAASAEDEAGDAVAEIDESLRSTGDGPVTAVVRLASDDRFEPRGDREGVTSQLRDRAEAAQEPVVAYAADRPDVEVVNRLWLANAVVVEADAGALEEIATIDGVDRIHPNFEVDVPDVVETAGVAAADRGDVTYGLDMINAPAVWEEFETRGEGVSVAVLDTGVDDGHPDLPELDDEHWQEWDQSGEPIDTEPSDGAGHGTHVSGTVVGSDDPAGDVPAYGVAPGAELYHGAVIPGGEGSFAQVVAGMEWAVDEVEADVASMSLGASGYYEEMIEPSENARDAGVVVVSSSGNDGENTSGSPGNIYPNVATGAVDADGEVAGFSSGEVVDTEATWGDHAPDYWPDEYVVPDAAAPGVNVLSSVPGGGYDDTYSGTSMAAPHKAGTYALMLSAMPDADRDVLTEALLETAEKPDGADVPDDEPDVRYGYGIIDAYAAVDGVVRATADTVLGDVTDTGTVTLADAILIEEEAAGVRVADAEFFEPAADLDRDGEVDDADSTLVQETAVGIVDPGEVEVSNVEAPSSVTGGDEIAASADLENVGDVGALQDVQFRLAPADEPLDEGAAVDERFVDLAAPGVDRPVDDPAETTIEFEAIPTEGLPGGEYEHGIFSDDDGATGTMTIDAPFFAVTDLETPAEVNRSDELAVEATIRNVGNREDTQSVEYRLGDLEAPTVVEENVTLAAGEETAVTFERTVDLEGTETYEHGVFTDDDRNVTDLTVNQWFFEVSGVSGPETVEHGDDVTVTATVENAGDAPAEQTIEYDLGVPEFEVAVVGDETGELAPFFDERLGDAYTVTELSPDELLDETDHDIYVVQQFGTTPAETFYEELSDTQATINLDQGATTTDGVERLHHEFDDPGTFQRTGYLGAGVDLHVQADHPIFDGVAEPGETVRYRDGANTNRAWFGDYGGEELAGISSHAGSSDGTAVGVDDEANRVLLSSSARSGEYAGHDSFTDAENAILVNAVEYAAEGQIMGDPVAEGDDGPVVHSTSRTVSLDPGENETVTFDETVSPDVGVGEFRHVVESEDDFDTSLVTVESPEFVNVTGLDAPAEVLQGETVSVEATLEHQGTEATTQDAELVFDGEVVDGEPVTLEPGETTSVDLETTIDAETVPGEYELGVTVDFDGSFDDVTVLRAEPAEFEVDEFDAPSVAAPGETYDVSATVENVGELADTQTVQYAFGEDPTVPNDEVSVAIVNYGGENWKGTYQDVLADRLDTDVYEFTLLEQGDDLASAMDDHDVFVVHMLDYDGDHEDNPEIFLDGLDDDQGVVYLSTYSPGPQQADGVEDLVAERGDPAEFDAWTYRDGDAIPQDVYHTILADHPIFDGVGVVGETVRVKDGGGGHGYWSAGNYSGTSLANVTERADGAAPDGATVGVDDDANEVLLGSLGLGVSPYDTADARTEAANRLFANAVEHVAFQAFGDAAGGANESGTATEVTLESGESTTVEFEFTVPADAELAEYDHGIYSEDDGDAGTITVAETTTELTVAGNVTDDAGAPIENATVTLAGGNETVAATETGADGSYEFVGVELADGTAYVVEADADGHEAAASEPFTTGDAADGVYGVEPLALVADDETAVGIVNYGIDDGDVWWDGAYRSILESHLDADDYEFGSIDHRDDLGEEMDGYDVFVVHKFADDEEHEDNPRIFLDNLTDDQGVVYLSTDGTGPPAADGVENLEVERANPEPFETGSYIDLGGMKDVYHTILADHPVFDGVGDVGETVRMKDGGGGHGYWPDAANYSGTALAEVTENGDGSSPDGVTIGVDDDANEVLLGSLGLGGSASDNVDARTEAANRTLANAVAYVADGTSGSATELTVAGNVTDDAGAPIENATVTLADGDGTVASAQTGADGSYEFVGVELADGTAYVVEADADGYGPDESEPFTTADAADGVYEVEPLALVADAGPAPSFDLGEVDGESFERGGTYERTATIFPDDGYDDGAEYTVELIVEDGSGDRINVSAEEAFTINDVFVPELGTVAGVVEDEEEAGVFYVDETAGGADLDDVDETFADLNATVDAEAATGNYTFTAGLVEWNGGDAELVGERDAAGFEIVESEGVSVGIVNYVENENDEWEGAYRSILESHLDADDYEFALLNHEVDLEAAMDDHDVFVVHRFGMDDGAYGDHPRTFLDNLTDDQGAVYLSTDGTGPTQADAVEALVDERGDPSEFETDAYTSGWGVPDGDVHHTILADHPVFEGVGDVGETVRMKDGGGGHGYWPAAANYSGTALAEVTENGDGSSPDGVAVGVDDDANEVLLGSLGLGGSTYDNVDARTEAANRTLANAVAYVADQVAGTGTAEAIDEGTASATSIDGDLALPDPSSDATREPTLA